MKKVNTVAHEVGQKYWIPIALLLLTTASFISGDVGVFTAIVFTFLVPGLITYRFFNLKSHEIWAFVPIFSVLVSVQMIYYLSLAVGYSQHTILAQLSGFNRNLCVGGLQERRTHNSLKIPKNKAD